MDPAAPSQMHQATNNVAEQPTDVPPLEHHTSLLSEASDPFDFNNLNDAWFGQHLMNLDWLEGSQAWDYGENMPFIAS